MKLAFAQIDAFADLPFRGNPAAVIPLDTWLDDRLLQAIAAENNLPGTAFFIDDPAEEAHFELRCFSPTAEVPLCGHAALAAGHYVMARMPDLARVLFRSRRCGLLDVRRDGSSGYAMALPACIPSARELPEVAAAAGAAPVETLWHDNGYVLLVLESAEQVRALRPDMARLAALGHALTIVAAPGEQTDMVSRVFAPAIGIPEDPVSGEAHAMLVPYWASRTGAATFTARQASRRGGTLQCGLAGDAVILGGSCVGVIDGHFLLPD